MLFLSRRKLSIDLISTIYPTLDDWSFERPGPVSYHWTSENLNGGKWGMTNKIWTAIYHCNSSMYIHKLLLWSVYQIQSQCKKHMVYQEKLIRQNVEFRFFFLSKMRDFSMDLTFIVYLCEKKILVIQYCWPVVNLVLKHRLL